MKRNNNIYARVSNIWNTDLTNRTTPIHNKIQIQRKGKDNWKYILFVNNNIDL